uniref:Monocarboxylate transporter 10-like n=1 Tax=Saccoglossus kowalevskii TaxID=10224 RepID=A0ABM0MYZ1_SACKO|nr:PREDICTED: monocarboxylate transporter 10-like [Saccoglossus kowalevskii]
MVLVKNRWGWVVAFTTFVVCIPITGILSAFGIIFVKLQGEYPEITDLETGWIGSMAFGMFFFASPISTGLFKRFGHRKVSFIGVFFVSVGLLGSSFVPHPRMLFLTYSILFGVGANFVDNASLNLIGQYFPRKNSARATCFATMGWSVGSLALNPSVEALCESVGWRNTFRILSGLMFVIGISCVVTFAPAPVERHWKSVEANLERKKQAEHASRTEQKQTVLVYLKTFKKTFQAPGIILWFIGNVLLNLSLIFPFINMDKYITVTY